MNFARSKTIYSLPGVLAQRHLMTLRKQEIGPILCKKGKPRNLDKPVDPRKKMIGDQLKAAIESPYFICFQYGSVKNSEWNDIRYELGKHNIRIKVFPNKISCKVLEDTKYKNITSLLKSSTASCFSTENNLKALLATMKNFPQLQLMGGKVDDRILSRNQVIEHGKLPPLEMAQAEFLQVLMQPPQKFGQLVNQSQRQLYLNLEQYVKQNSGEPENSGESQNSAEAQSSGETQN